MSARPIVSDWSDPVQATTLELTTLRIRRSGREPPHRVAARRRPTAAAGREPRMAVSGRTRGGWTRPFP
jgi:hypothetical protein